MGVTAPGVVPPAMVAATVELAAEKAWVVTATSAAGVTAVGDAEEARLGLAMAPDVATGASSDLTTGVVAAALGEATLDRVTAQQAVQLGMAPGPLSARPCPQARNAVLAPGSMATDPKPYSSLDKMWKAFNDLAHTKTPAVNDENICSLFLSLIHISEPTRPY